MERKKHIWILTLIAGIAVGTLPAFTHIALETMNPATITLVRYIDTVIGLLIFALVFRQPIQWRNVWRVLPISLFAAVNAMCFAVGVHYLQPASIQLLYTVVPLLVAAFSWYILRQHTSWSKVLGLLIGLGGVSLVAVAPLLHSGGSIAFHPFGTAIVFLGAISFSLYTVLSKPAQDKASPSDILMGTAVATIVLQTAFMLITSTPFNLSDASMRSFAASLVVGFVGTAFFYWLYQYIVKISSPLIASVTQYVMPVFGALWAYVIIDDTLTLLTIVGGIIALVGAAQVNGIWRALGTKPTKQF